MPIYMDRHDIPGVTAKDVAEAHQEDLKIQNNYDCRALTYWFDEEKGMAFCLIEAPDKAAVQNLHNRAHGLIPNQIIEVEPKVVEAFLGRIKDPEEQGTDDHMPINDPAFRTIMVIDLDETVQVNSKVETKEAYNILKKIHKTIREELNEHKGLEAEHTNECFIASFASVNQSVLCALAIQKHFRKYNAVAEHKINARIGLSAGVPVSGDNVFFGSTIKLAKRLCFIAPTEHIMLASLVNELYISHHLTHRIEENLISALRPKDEKLLNHLMDLMDMHGNDASFGVEIFGRQMGMSKSQLYRKVTSVTGYSPNDLIKEHRLTNALNLIKQQKGNISEIAYDAGFSSLSYFSKCFQKRFHALPSDYARAVS